ncbi:hypothetical protein PIB30_048239 [Stylosanthes scabra]|uniref:Uncharacterized protein n=1 Tax=Stylosanthes scabra TaxID=79078 RepID=A0ABU6WGW7_9FABA|nr:hypothetical protein [Stylosanthes scabra]
MATLLGLVLRLGPHDRKQQTHIAKMGGDASEGQPLPSVEDGRNAYVSLSDGTDAADEETQSCARRPPPRPIENRSSEPTPVPMPARTFLSVRSNRSTAYDAGEDPVTIARQILKHLIGLRGEVTGVAQGMEEHRSVVTELKAEMKLMREEQRVLWRGSHYKGYRCHEAQSSGKCARGCDVVSNRKRGWGKTNGMAEEDPTYVPTLDITYSEDHMPFRSKRPRKCTQNLVPDYRELENSVPTMVDLTSSLNAGQHMTGVRTSTYDDRHGVESRYYNYLSPPGSDGTIPVTAIMKMTPHRLPKVR